MVMEWPEQIRRGKKAMSKKCRAQHSGPHRRHGDRNVQTRYPGKCRGQEIIKNNIQEESRMKDEKKKKVFYKWMDSSQVKMYGKKVGDKWVKGIEDFIPNEQYQTDEYVMGIISDIKKKWLIYSLSLIHI